MRRRVAITAGVVVLVLAGIAAALAAFAWRPALDPVQPLWRESFDAALIDKGAGLASIGNCISCHTAQGGKPFAGGRPIETPFGMLYGSNITPDPQTGIGRWSQAAFVRAMRQGVDREGRHLYPAFPYDHFTRVSDEDLAALYAFVMTREPVQARAPEPDLAFPFNLRMLLAGWKALFLEERRYQADAAQSEQWNRGAYLAQGLAHCGSCHTPRNFLGAEKKSARYAGGEAGGWHGTALNASNPAPAAWNAERLFAYLRGGDAELHGVAAGPMADVAHNLRQAPETEVRAIAEYVAALIPAKEEQAAQGGSSAPAAPSRSGTIYAGACASCHGASRAEGSALPLSLSSAVASPSPANLLRIIRDGIQPREGERGPWMPSYAGAFTPAQLAELANYVRQEFAGKPPWNDIENDVGKLTRGEP